MHSSFFFFLQNVYNITAARRKESRFPFCQHEDLILGINELINLEVYSMSHGVPLASVLMLSRLSLCQACRPFPIPPGSENKIRK